MDIRKVQSGDALIRRGEPDRTLYFVLRGELEMIVQSSDGFTMGRVARVGAGAVLGTRVFDGGPRSATAWAVTPCEVAASVGLSTFCPVSPMLSEFASARSTT